jgi:hypothetical protein
MFEIEDLWQEQEAEGKVRADDHGIACYRHKEAVAGAA